VKARSSASNGSDDHNSGNKRELDDTSAAVTSTTSSGKNVNQRRSPKNRTLLKRSQLCVCVCVCQGGRSGDDDGTSTSDRRERERDRGSDRGSSGVDGGKRRRMELADMKIERPERKIEDDGKHIVLVRGLHSQGALYIILSTYT
jgi:hypothetical protein